MWWAEVIVRCQRTGCKRKSVWKRTIFILSFLFTFCCVLCFVRGHFCHHHKRGGHKTTFHSAPFCERKKGNFMHNSFSFFCCSVSFISFHLSFPFTLNKSTPSLGGHTDTRQVELSHLDHLAIYGLASVSFYENIWHASFIIFLPNYLKNAKAQQFSFFNPSSPPLPDPPRTPHSHLINLSCTWATLNAHNFSISRETMRDEIEGKLLSHVFVLFTLARRVTGEIKVYKFRFTSSSGCQQMSDVD